MSKDVPWLSDYDRRRYEKTNQEVIQQNVHLHSQLRLAQQENQRTKQDLLELKGRFSLTIHEYESLRLEMDMLKKEIGDRVPALKLIAQHISRSREDSHGLIANHIDELSEFLKQISSSRIVGEMANAPERISDFQRRSNKANTPQSILSTIEETLEEF